MAAEVLVQVWKVIQDSTFASFPPIGAQRVFKSLGAVLLTPAEIRWRPHLCGWEKFAE
jgi:hypothetical protein